MSWICPHCGTTATLQQADYARGIAPVLIATAPEDEGIGIRWNAVKCPSKTCGKYVLDISTVWGRAETRVDGYGRRHRTGEIRPDDNREFGIGKIRVEPRVGVPLSAHVPAPVRQDYEEAWLIKDLSPKASATLCRRALQGMIRNYWGIVKPTLHEELTAIKSQCDADLYGAMMGLKSIGNIGAHPEKDINIIVDIEEGEAEALLGLLQILDKEWYVARADRQARLGAVKQLGQVKSAAKAVSTAAASPARLSPP